MDKLLIYIDGASSGNPGRSGIGVWIRDSRGVEVNRLSRPLGITTNNVAEYSALICALEEAERLKARSVNIYTDSQLLERQINGRYKVKDACLKDLYTKAKLLIGRIPKVEISHIKREENAVADKLSKQAVKKNDNNPKTYDTGTQAGQATFGF